MAIDLTTQTIDKRARYYRHLVVAVVTVGFISIGLALVIGAFLPLLGLLLLFPMCALYFIMDANVLNQWRARLFEQWIQKEIAFSGFLVALKAIPYLPKETLDVMLTSLPFFSNMSAEQAISSTTREAVAANIQLNHVMQVDAMVFKLLYFSLVITLIISAAVLSLWQPLLGIIIMLTFPTLQGLIKRRRMNALVGNAINFQQKPDFDLETYQQISEKNNYLGY